MSSREERIDAVQVPDDPSEKQDTNSLVEGELRRNPNAKSKEIAEAIERADQTVRQTRAWKANRQRLKELSQQRPVRTVPLTNAMLVVTDSKAGDPAEIASQREERERREHAHPDHPEAIESIEVLKRRYLEGAEADQRARFHRLTPADQEHELRSWELTGDRVT